MSDMPGKIIECSLSSVIDCKCTGSWPNTKYTYTLNKQHKNTHKDDTILLVVSRGQEGYGAFLDSCKELNILHKSKKAVNTNYKDYGPRNTLYVVEYV
jgi:hypothetical protein